MGPLWSSPLSKKNITKQTDFGQADLSQIDWLGGKIFVSVRKKFKRAQKNNQKSNWKNSWEKKAAQREHQPTITELRREARRNALEEARQRLVSAVFNLPLDSSSRIKDKIKQDQSFRRRMSSLESLFIVDLSRTETDSAYLVLSLPFAGERGLYGLLGYFKNNRIKLPKIETQKEPLVISSIILVLKDHEFEPSLSPHIYSQEGLLLYSQKIVKRSCFIKKGLVSYYSSVEMARKNRRAGMHPYLAYAAALEGKSSLVLHNSDTENILSSPYGHISLQNCRVLLVINSPKS